MVANAIKAHCAQAILVGLLLLSELWQMSAATINPPQYRGGINLITNGGTVVRAIACSKDLIYASVDAQTCYPNQPLSAATVFTVDVSNPANMQYLAKGSIGGCKANGLMAYEDRLYVANWSTLLTTFDVCNRTSINPLGSFHVAGDASWSLSVQGDRVYLGEAHELAESFYIIDISNPSNPRMISATDWAGGPTVSGAYSYWGDFTWLKVLNISDETAPTIVGGVDLGVNVGDPQLRGNLLFAPWNLGDPSSGTSGIVCVDISDPIAPREVGRWTTPDFYYFGGLYLLGDFAYVPTGGNGIFAVNIANPTNMFAVAQFEVPFYALELCVSGNGRYLYSGTVEGAPDRHGGVHAWQVSTQDPDDAPPGNWKNFSPRQTSFDLQFEGNALPTASTPAWTLYEGTETWASVSNGVLRVNDTGTVSNDKIKWIRNWDATSSRGGTVMVRARCASYNDAGAFIANLFIEDAKYSEEFSILSDRIRARNAGLEYALDGTQWHTYRITTLSNQFRVYVDENPTAALTGPLSVPANRARIYFGSGSSPARQDIYFDYVYAFAGGAVGPGAATSDPTPNVSVGVSDIAGKGSTSGLATNTARVHWSTDGGATWSSSGGISWNGNYEGNEVPSASNPSWYAVEGSEIYASASNGVLRVNDPGTGSNTKLKYERLWRASPAVGATVIARARCAAAGGDTTFTGNLFIEDGAHEESLKILSDRIVARSAGLTYLLNATNWHIYRITLRSNQFKIYVDENPAPVLTGVLNAPSSNNRVMFGSGASAGTQDIYFDWVRYCTTGDLPPGQGDGGGIVPVNMVLPACGDRVVERCTLSAPAIPFHRYSETDNKVRFSIADIEGNVGWSPAFTVRVPMIDTDADGMDDQWERDQFGNLMRNGTGDFDQDGQSDRQEFLASTFPTNPASVFKVTDVSRTPGGAVSLRWNSVAGRRYRVQYKSTLSAGVWSDAPNPTVTATTITCVWSNSAQPSPQRFYKVLVE